MTVEVLSTTPKGRTLACRIGSSVVYHPAVVSRAKQHPEWGNPLAGPGYWLIEHIIQTEDTDTLIDQWEKATTSASACPPEGY